jgi:hypothetical protein
MPEKMFREVVSETCRMVLKQTDIFIQVEHDNLLPIDTPNTHEMSEGFQLARAGSEYDARTTLPLYRFDQYACCVPCCQLTKLGRVFTDN